MPHTVFFSWQADTPTITGRNFIERALTKALDQLNADLEVDEPIRDEGLRVDKDTAGVAGTPPIVDTIFKKIDLSSAFVADLTFVGTRMDGRPIPNPNVLLEYGWSLKSRGFTRIIVLMNSAYGEPSDATLPFNMKHLKHPITYNLPDGADETARKLERDRLVGTLKSAIKAIIQSQEFQDALPKPPEVKRFEARQTVDGPARFQFKDKPIGVAESPFGLAPTKEVVLQAGPAIWLRVMPDAAQSREWSITEIRQRISTNGRTLLPLGYFSEWGHIRAPDGFGYLPSRREEEGLTSSVILAFKSGEIWSVFTGPLSMQNSVVNVESIFVECFVRCVQFLRDGLGIAMPYRWIAGIEGMKGKRLPRIASPGYSLLEQYTGECLEDTITETGLLVDGDQVQLSLNPFFRRLYDACGAQRAEHVNEHLVRQFQDVPLPKSGADN